MEIIYICPRDIWESNTYLFVESHYIVLDDGSLLVNCRFASKGAEIAWRAMPGVEMLSDGIPMKASHVAKMKSLGVQQGHDLATVEQLASQRHPLLRRMGK